MSAKYIPPAQRGERRWGGSMVVYSLYDICRVIPGDTNHTFTRRCLSQEDSEACFQKNLSAERVLNDPVELEVYGDSEKLPEPPTRLYSNEIGRIMVHEGAHINPPNELWTRNNIKYLEENKGKPIPLFREAPFYSSRKGEQKKFEFKGHYEIIDFNVYHDGKEVREFVLGRRDSRRVKPAETWGQALNDTWAKVELRP
ncbi:hypothetical protein NEOLEDRAFT_1171982, partial [Neolentinus lepideus HHB14362 ss-1]